MHKLVLVRHGESTWNKENLFTGWTDVDLDGRVRATREDRVGARLAATPSVGSAPCRTAFARVALTKSSLRQWGAIGHYFGWVPKPEEVERFARLLPAERTHAVFDGDQAVAGAGAFTFDLTVPGSLSVPCAGVTVVGTLPTHRRRGLLTRMMRAQLDDVRERGEPIAALFASEETLYGRYGYGLASLRHRITLPRTWASMRPDSPPRTGSVRLVDQYEARRSFPRI